MADIFDYIRWRGDLTFDQVPFNEVDALILAQSTYLNYSPFVSSTYTRWITIGEVAKSDYTEYMPVDQRIYALICAMGKSRRFQSIQCAAVSDIFDPKEIIQFMAITFKLPDGTCVIAYRGTDTSITGWHENCTMALTSPITAQIHATEYLNTASKFLCRFNRRKLILVGHSKGGNEAIYAAAFCSPKTRRSISSIYSFDSPGFDSTMYSSGVFSHIVDRCHTFVPTESVVGMIMNHEELLQPVTSIVKGPMQHDPFYWDTANTTLEYADAIAPDSLALHKAINEWLQKIPLSDRQEFVDTLFGILDSAGIKNFEDLQVSASSKVFRILHSMITADSEHKRLLHNVFNDLFASYRKHRSEIPFL